MSRFRIDHPSRPNIHAIYGHDPVLGFFVDVFIEGREKPIASYDTWGPAFSRERPLLGCLDFLVSERFFSSEDFEDALVAIADDLDVISESVRRVVEVIDSFKAAAD